MPVLLLIVLALAAFVALFVAASSVGPFLEVRRFHGANVHPIATLSKGTEATVRGTIIGTRRAPPYPRISPGEVVFSLLEVREQVGNRINVALRAKNAQVFTIRDADGATIDVDPAMAELMDGHSTTMKASQTPPPFLSYVNRTGSYAWQNTPAICHEEAIRIGDVITTRGQVVLPLPGQMKQGDTELRITARKIAIHGVNPWKGPNGRALALGLIATAVTVPAALACAAWAGFL